MDSPNLSVGSDDESSYHQTKRRRSSHQPSGGGGCGAPPRLTSPLVARSVNTHRSRAPSPEHHATHHHTTTANWVNGACNGAAEAAGAQAVTSPSLWSQSGGAPMAGAPAAAAASLPQLLHLTPHHQPHLRPPPIHTVSSMDGYDFGSPGLNFGDATLPPTTPRGVHFMAQPLPTPTPGTGSHGWGRNHGGGSGLRFGDGPASGLRSRGSVSAMSLVAPNLYVGDESAAASLARLRAHGVTHVLNCTDQPNALEDEPEAPTFMRLGLLDSSADLPRMATVLPVGVEFIQAAISGGGTVLVHCHRGISRSVTLAMAYLIWAEQRPAEQVFETIRSTRKVVDPNLGFWMALKEWEAHVLPPAALRPKSTNSSAHSTPRPSARASPRLAAHAALAHVAQTTSSPLASAASLAGAARTAAAAAAAAIATAAITAGIDAAGADVASTEVPHLLRSHTSSSTICSSATMDVADGEAEAVIRPRNVLVSPVANARSPLASPLVSASQGAAGHSVSSRSPANSYSSGTSGLVGFVSRVGQGGSTCGSPTRRAG